MKSERMHNEIVLHMEQHIGPVQENALIEGLPVTGIAINVIPPAPDRDWITLFTTGMSDKILNVAKGIDACQHAELLMKLPSEWPMSMADFEDDNHFWPFKWLRILPGFLLDPQRPFHGAFTIVASDDPPAAFAPDTLLSCLMLLPGAEAGRKMNSSDGRTIGFFNLMPLYTEERDFELAHGLRELFQRFQRARISQIVDPYRVNVALDRED